MNITLKSTALTVALVLVVSILIASAFAVSSARSDDPKMSERKSMEDSLPMTMRGLNYTAEVVQVSESRLSMQDAIDSVVDAYMSDNQQLSEIRDVRSIFERENRAQIVVASGQERVSRDSYIQYNDRLLWMVELTSVPTGGGSCGPWTDDDCPPPGRAPYFKGLVDAETGEVVEWMYQGFGSADPIWASVNQEFRERRDAERAAIQEAIDRGEIAPPTTSTAAPAHQ